MDEFREEDVLDIVREALDIVAEDAPVTQSYIPLAFNEGRLLEVLCEQLPKYALGNADIQVILAELREELYSKVNPPANLRTLHSVTRNCRRCPNLMHPADLPAWNVTDPDCLFVVESPSALSPEATQLLIDGLSKAGFKSRNIGMTYVNRCKAKARKHTGVEIANCMSYLHAEIQLMKPKLIVPLGLVSSSVVLSTPVELGEERGKIMWLGPWAVMPTWAPGYVKRAGGRVAEQLAQDFTSAFNFVYGRSD
jgi:uracil-DNA glycosylase family 4